MFTNKTQHYLISIYSESVTLTIKMIQYYIEFKL